MKAIQLTQLIENRIKTLLPDSNIGFLGFGRDKNGNSLIKLFVRDEDNKDHNISIQTNNGGEWNRIHNMRTNPDSLTLGDLEYIRDVAERFILVHGSFKLMREIQKFKDYQKKNKAIKHGIELPKTTKPKVDID